MAASSHFTPAPRSVRARGGVPHAHGCLGCSSARVRVGSGSTPRETLNGEHDHLPLGRHARRWSWLGNDGARGWSRGRGRGHTARAAAPGSAGGARSGKPLHGQHDDLRRRARAVASRNDARHGGSEHDTRHEAGRSHVVTTSTNLAMRITGCRRWTGHVTLQNFSVNATGRNAISWGSPQGRDPRRALAATERARGPMQSSWTKSMLP